MLDFVTGVITKNKLYKVRIKKKVFLSIKPSSFRPKRMVASGYKFLQQNWTITHFHKNNIKNSKKKKAIQDFQNEKVTFLRETIVWERSRVSFLRKTHVFKRVFPNSHRVRQIIFRLEYQLSTDSKWQSCFQLYNLFPP